MNKDEKIVHAFQAADRVTVLTDKGNLYTLEHSGGIHYWKPIVISEAPVGSSPSGQNRIKGN